MRGASGRFPRLVLLAAAALVLGALLVPWARDPLARLELASINLRFSLRGPLKKPSDIVVVGVDDETFREIGSPRITRRLYARALTNLAEAGPRVVALDVLFSEPSPDDPELARALRRLGRVVVAATLETHKAGGFTVVEFRPPVEPVRGAATIGVVELPEDEDFFIRRARLLHKHQGRYLPSFALATAALAAGVPVSRAVEEAERGRFSGRRLPLLPDGSIYINFVGPPGLAFDYVPFYQLLEGGLPRERLEGKIVLIGATSPALHDVYPTPFSSGERRMPGVEIQAHAVYTLLRGEFVKVPPPWARGLLSFLLAALCVVAVVRLKPLLGGAASASLLGAWALLSLAAFVKWSLLLPVVAPLLLGALGAGGSVVGLYFSVERKRRELRRLFERYVSPEVLREVLSRPGEVELGGEEVEATVMFCDLHGFTTISEGLRPAQVVELLNRYLERAVAVIKRHGGTVDKFIGDGVMAFFGAPIKHADHPRRAVEAALDLKEAVASEVNPELERLGLPKIKVRVGIHTGPVVVGNVGSPERMEYTAIGDTVNVASRLEGLNKEFGTSIIVGETTFERLDGGYKAKPLGEVKVRGREEPLKVFAVEGRARGDG